MRAFGVAAKSELYHGSIKIRSKPPFVEVTPLVQPEPDLALWLGFVDTSLRPSDSIGYGEVESSPGVGTSFHFGSVDMALVCSPSR